MNTPQHAESSTDLNFLPAPTCIQQDLSDSIATFEPSPLQHVVWINQHAAFLGGCEHYIARAAEFLKEQQIRNTLLYEVDGEIDTRFTSVFDAAFPLVDVHQQIASIGGDIGYVHRIENLNTIAALRSSGMPCVRFYHDHALFCLREHKYTTIGSRTCVAQTGLGCYGCLGFLKRTETWPGFGVQSLSDLQHRQDSNLHWDGHVVGSQYMADHLALHGFDETRIHVAPLFVSPPEPTSTPWRPRQSRLLVFAGQLVRGKGVDTLLHALTRLPNDICLRIAGEGRQKAELTQLSAQLGLATRVDFVGKLERRELIGLFQEATVVAMPSRAPETFGLAGLEAASCGAAIVASNVGGISQWLQHERNGLMCPPNDPAALADAMTTLFESEELREQLATVGLARCREEFTPKRHVLRLLKLFRHCVQGE